MAARPELAGAGGRAVPAGDGLRRPATRTGFHLRGGVVESTEHSRLAPN